MLALPQSICTLLATVASAEPSVSKLKLIKNYMRSTVNQDRPKDLAVLRIESKIARTVDFNDFVNMRARKVLFEI